MDYQIENIVQYASGNTNRTGQHFLTLNSVSIPKIGSTNLESVEHINSKLVMVWIDQDPEPITFWGESSPQALFQKSSIGFFSIMRSVLRVEESIPLSPSEEATIRSKALASLPKILDDVRQSLKIVDEAGDINVNTNEIVEEIPIIDDGLVDAPDFEEKTTDTADIRL